jgi:hypothetical protein
MLHSLNKISVWDDTEFPKKTLHTFALADFAILSECLIAGIREMTTLMLTAKQKSFQTRQAHISNSSGDIQ